MLPPSTPRIRLLPPAIAERIAAGEVIERPASVVKELVENAIDAGATDIEVRLEEGGRALIEVTDNGRGMDAEDLQLATQRHATSKLSSLDDLETLVTLGFRGEALPSIAAVSDLTLLTRAQGQDTAYQLNPYSKIPKPATHGHFLQTTHGTRIQARGLFSTVPARLKFLKSPSAELSHVREWLERLALTAPHIGFALQSDERTVMRLRPQSRAERVRTVLAGQDDLPVIEVEHGAESSTQKGIRAKLLWVQGWVGPQSRKLVQVVNGRALKDRLLQQAMLSGFRQAMLPGQYPALALYLEVDPSVIDVNVHPTKAEVRFLESGPIFRVVQSLCHELIQRAGAPAHVAGPDVSSPEPRSQPVWSAPSWIAREPEAIAPPAQTAAFEFMSPPVATDRSPLLPERPETPLAQLLTGAEYIGQVFQTFLLFQRGEEMISIDPHAAHERIRYEQLKRQTLGNESQDQPAQALLVPEAVKLDRERLDAFRTRVPLLARIGFETEEFGLDDQNVTLLFRSIPPSWGSRDLRARLVGLVERMSSMGSEGQESDDPRWDSVSFEALASEACHSSVRANERLERAEALGLVEQLLACEHPWNCPHGRPTVARIPRARFEEWFQRRPSL